MESSFKAKTQINLNEKEQEIFGTLKNVLQKYELKTTLRVAGGWVRDKVTFYQATNIYLFYKWNNNLMFCSC